MLQSSNQIHRTQPKDREKRSEPLELLAIFLLGSVLRLYAGRNSLQGENVLLVGYDEFYHMRRILYTVAHFPSTLWFDSYLDYPHGMKITWPPFFDQLMAAVSLALGQHSQHGIEMVSATLPTILGSIAAVVVYYLVKEIFDRKVALMSAFMTALAPYYLQESMLGETGHHWLVELWFMLAVMFMILALSRKDNIYLFAAVAGVAMTGEAYTWLGSSAYFGVFMIYVVIQITLDLKNEKSSSNTVKIMLVPFGLTLAFTLFFWNASWLFPAFFGSAVITAAIVVLFAISKFMLERRLSWVAFPTAIVLIAGAFIVLSQTLRSIWIFSEVNQIIITGVDYLMSGQMTGKISEAEPLFARPEIFFSNFIFSNLGWNLIFSTAGLVVLIGYLLHSKTNDGKNNEARLLFLVFVVFTLILTVGQIRFLELSSISMGILISILFFQAADFVSQMAAGLGKLPRLSVIALLFILLVLPTTFEAISITDATPQIADDWYNSLTWLEKNSNTTSWYDNPDKTPEYSVMSLWDYGNWVVYQAKRPVVANNFQTGIEDSSKFYLSENELTATAVLDARGTRYVITDYDMLYVKLPGIAFWANQDPSAYQTTVDLGKYTAATPTKKLMQTTLARLHFFDGSAMGRLRLIYESHTLLGSNPPTNWIKIFEYVPGALIKVSAAPNQKVGALLNMTSNQGRAFQYVNEGIQYGNGYEIRVPYSTEKKYDTHALAPYLVFAGNSSTEIKIKKINVTEDDVLKGRVLEVNL